MSMTEIEKMEAEALGVNTTEANEATGNENGENPEVDTNRIAENALSGLGGFMLGFAAKALIDRDPQARLQKKAEKEAKKAEKRAARIEKKEKLKKELDELKAKTARKKFHIGWIETPEAIPENGESKNVVEDKG